jgi:hypothetical protein
MSTRTLKYVSRALFTVAVLYAILALVVAIVSLVLKEWILAKSVQQAILGLILVSSEIIGLIWYGRLLHKEAAGIVPPPLRIWTAWAFLVLAVVATIAGIYVVAGRIAFIDMALLLAVLIVGVFYRRGSSA